MSNIRESKDFFDIVTGKYSSHEASHIWTKKDNVKVLYDSRGQYLGLMKQNERVIKAKSGRENITCKGGKYYFRPFYELAIWKSAKMFRFNDDVAVEDVGVKVSKS